MMASLRHVIHRPRCALEVHFSCSGLHKSRLEKLDVARGADGSQLDISKPQPKMTLCSFLVELVGDRIRAPWGHRPSEQGPCLREPEEG